MLFWTLLNESKDPDFDQIDCRHDGDFQFISTLTDYATKRPRMRALMDSKPTSVIRWLDCLFNIWSFSTIMKIWPIA